MICVPEQRQSCWDAEMVHLGATNPALKQVQDDFFFRIAYQLSPGKSKYIARFLYASVT